MFLPEPPPTLYKVEGNGKASVSDTLNHREKSPHSNSGWYKPLLKLLTALSFLFFGYAIRPAFPATINDTQLIRQDHWVYDAMAKLTMEAAIVNFTERSPLTVGELKFYLEEIAGYQLSPAGEALYQQVHNFLYTSDNWFQGLLAEKTGFSDRVLAFSADLVLNPELYYKSNPDIDWSHTYYFVDNLLTVPVRLGISNYLSFGADIFLGMNYAGAQQNHNLSNIPIPDAGTSTHEFTWPRFTYGAAGATFTTWGVNALVGKEGMAIGRTETGSILYNSTFETDSFIQLNAFTRNFKYSLDTVQVSKDKYLYLHHFDVRLFKKLRVGMLEGSLVDGPFELRFLNPFMIMHSFAGWTQYNTPAENEIYGEGHFCAIMAFTLDFTPIKNLRIYGIYNQIEMQTAGEKESLIGQSYPDSIGGQLGVEFIVPDRHKGYWTVVAEGVYTSPFLYIKQSPDWSLVRARNDELNSSRNPIYSWMGSPFGPDTIAGYLGVTYQQPGRWELGLSYLFAAQGTNDTSLFDKKKKTVTLDDGTIVEDEWYDYYPRVQINTGTATEEEAAARARYMGLTGTVEYRNQLTLSGSYHILENLKVSGKCVYTFTFNSRNVPDNFQQGVELGLALTYNLNPSRFWR